MRATSTDALVLVDKPAGVTSFDVVRQVGRAVGTRRVGHAGTLDPFATGLLVVMSGVATRCIRFVSTEPKVYLATISFGTERDTDDVTGQVTRDAAPPSLEAIRDALPGLTGVLAQVPPAYSAKKVDGQRAYALARGGATVTLAASRVTVHQWEEVAWGEGQLVARVTCGTGTYIRALARDLGRTTGSAAHLSSLRRERSGPFHVDEATSWEALRRGEAGARAPLDALRELPVVTLDATEAARARHGATVARPESLEAAAAVLCGPQGEWLGIARVSQGVVYPIVVHG
ncbi:MAG: tRNA pseudouridine(55) synthase TruB [Gemmatimonadetes bacterium]|nr:tRNA pseudouridine(55) synthase TruB [Gemmatimonadota bacterium]